MKEPNPFAVALRAILLRVPLAEVAVAGSLRLAKGLLLALDYGHRAGEGRSH